MPAPYDQDLRDRILRAYDRGTPTKQIAITFDVSPAYARRCKQVRRDEGRVTPLPMGGVRVVKVDLDELRALHSQQPDATIPELHRRFGTHRCSESAIGAALVRLGLSFKKRRSTPASRIVRMWQRNARTGWPGSRNVMPDDSSSSTRPGPEPT